MTDSRSRRRPPCPTPADILYAAFFSWPGDALCSLDIALQPLEQAAAAHGTTVDKILGTVTSHALCFRRFLTWLRGSKTGTAYPLDTSPDDVVVMRIEGMPDPAVTADECWYAWRRFLKKFKDAVRRGEEVDVVSANWWTTLEHHATSWCAGNSRLAPASSQNDGTDDEGAGGAPASPPPLPKPHDEDEDEDHSGPKGP
jgi:hypothetical protein